MQQVTDFICSRGAHIKKIWFEVPLGGVQILLPDSLDALDMIDVFMQSGLFLFIHPLSPYRINSNPGDPNNPYYNYNSSIQNGQWYLQNGTGGIKTPSA